MTLAIEERWEHENMCCMINWDKNNKGKPLFPVRQYTRVTQLTISLIDVQYNLFLLVQRYCLCKHTFIAIMLFAMVYIQDESWTFTLQIIVCVWLIKARIELPCNSVYNTTVYDTKSPNIQHAFNIILRSTIQSPQTYNTCLTQCYVLRYKVRKHKTRV